MSSIDGSPGGDPSSFFGGSGSQAGILGTGQFHSDPYHANAAAFAPDANENAYITQLQGMANGTAPSAAQMQMTQGLQQATGQAQALAASQRGISPALAARYAGLQQSGMQQGVAANTAALRAQEQNSAMGQLGNEMQSVRAGRMGLENLNSGNENFSTGANLQGYTSAAANRGNMMSHIGNALTGSMMGAKGGMVTHQGFVQPQGYAGGGMIAPGSFNHTPSLGPISAPAAWANSPQGKKDPPKKPDDGSNATEGTATPWETGGGMAGGPSDAGGLADSGFAFAADGGEVESMAQAPQTQLPNAAPAGWSGSGGGGGGGGIMKMLPMLAMAMNTGGEVDGPKSHTAKFLKQALEGGGQVQRMSFGGLSGAEGPGWGQMLPQQNFSSMLAQPQGMAPGKPEIPNGGPQYLSGKSGTQNPASSSVDFNLMGQNNHFQTNRDPGYQFYGKSGGTVPGKASVPGNSLANDKVPTMLSPKEIVIPRSITLGKNPGDKAKAFVDKIMASHNKGKKNGSK